jgi:hypothetical protein
MANTDAGQLMKSVERLISERKAVAAKEQQLVTSLNSALKEIGFQVVASPDGSTGSRSGGLGVKRAARRGVSPPRRRRKMTAAARKAVGARMKAYWAKRKRTSQKKAAAKPN